MKRVGFIGGGNMGLAIMSRIYKEFPLGVCEKDQARALLLKKKFKAVSLNIPDLAHQCQIVVLAVKPADMDAVLEELKKSITSRHLIISIAAGLTTAYFEKKLGGKPSVIRSMPNMPGQIAQGITALCAGRYASKADLAIAKTILGNIGETLEVEEKLMDMVTAVSGSGPAYVFLFTECFIQSALDLGCEASMAQKLVLSTLKGSVLLLEQSKEDPAVLRQKVTSKGGTTQAAMDVFMKAKIQSIFTAALKAAKIRSGELAR